MSDEPVTGGEPGKPEERTVAAEPGKATAARDPLLGRVLGAYRIQEHVGEGTGLPSYLAEHVHLERKVLFKLFHPPRGEGEAEAIRRAMQQARELSALKHEGVLPLVEIAECGDGFMYVVLELSGALPLPALLAERGPLRWPTARVLGRQIAAGLMAAEAASLASAEPTASQIFVTGVDSGEPRARVDLVTPEALGWVPARSPDQARAVGRLLYTMLSGHEPAGAHDQEAQPLPDLVLGSPEHEVPADADALVMRAVDPERARRWPDLATLHRELGGRDVATKEHATAEPNPMASTMRLLGGEEHDEHDDVTFGRRLFARPSRPALIAGGVGILAALIVALAIVSGPSDSDTAASRVTAEKFKLAPIPPPQPMALPPPPVPAPEDQPSQPDAATVPAGAAAVAASPEGATPAAAAPASKEAAPAAGAVAVPPVPAVPAAAPVAAAVVERGTPSRATGAPAPGAATPAAPRALAAATPSKAPAPRPAAPVSAPAPAVAALTAAALSGPTAGTATPAAAPAAAPAKTGAGSPCTLSLGSIPWSDVQVDGQRAGFTPLTDFPVACGTHEILFTSPDRGLARKITLSVRPGEKVKRIVDLGGPKATPAGLSATAPARPPCRLTLGSKPWSEVWIDGNRAGTTPLVDYPVTCGTHDVLFLSRETNVQHRESLTVQSTLKRVITLVESSD